MKKAKALNPQDMEVRYEEVRLLEAQSKYTEAITLLKALVDETARPKYSASEGAARGQLLEELASLYRTTGQFNESVDAYRKAATLNKENSAAISLQIIDTYRAAKNPEGVHKEVDAAAAELRTRMNGKADVPALLMLASVYEKGRFFTEEAKVLDEAEKLAANPKEKESVYFMRGAMFERQKKVEPAEAEFRKVLAIQSGAFRRVELPGLHAGGPQGARRGSHADDQEGVGWRPGKRRLPRQPGLGLLPAR